MPNRKQKQTENLLATIVIGLIAAGVMWGANQNVDQTGEEENQAIDQVEDQAAADSSNLRRKHSISVGQVAKVEAITADGISIDSSSHIDGKTLRIKMTAGSSDDIDSPLVEISIDLVIDGDVTAPPTDEDTTTDDQSDEDPVSFGFLELVPVWVKEIDDPNRDSTTIKLAMAYVAAQGSTPAEMLASVQRAIVGILGEGENRKRWKPFFSRFNTRLNELIENGQVNSLDDYREAFIETAAGFRRAAK